MTLSESILHNLPQKLDFYGVGALEREDPASPNGLQTAGMLDGIAVHIIPDDEDSELWLLMLFPRGQDNSCFAEAANLLASMTAKKLHAWISPPIHMTGTRLSNFIASGTLVTECNYSIRVHEEEFRLKTLFLSSVQEIQHDV